MSSWQGARNFAPGRPAPRMRMLSTSLSSSADERLYGLCACDMSRMGNSVMRQLHLSRSHCRLMFGATRFDGWVLFICLLYAPINHPLTPRLRPPADLSVFRSFPSANRAKYLPARNETGSLPEARSWYRRGPGLESGSELERPGYRCCQPERAPPATSEALPETPRAKSVSAQNQAFNPWHVFRRASREICVPGQFLRQFV
jgi:hypothetical protein